jgi:hypothetical protein
MKTYKFNPTENMKKFLHPDIVALAGTIDNAWDQALIDMFPGCFEPLVLNRLF